MAPLAPIYRELEKCPVSIEYLKPLAKYDEEKPYLLALDIPVADESDRTNLDFGEVRLEAANARSVQEKISIESHSFELFTLPPGLMARYFGRLGRVPEMEGVHNLLADRFKAEKVIVYDHAHRVEEDRSEEAKYTFSNRPTHSIIVRNPHADQSTTSGRKRVETFLTLDEQERYCNDKWRIRIINFWKPIYHRIQRAPLLLCDPLSVSSADILLCDVVSQQYVGEVLFLKYSPTHRWFWFKGQEENEALLFVSYDSHGPGNGVGCFHSSCNLLDDVSVPTIKDCPRESVEVRALVISSLDC